MTIKARVHNGRFVVEEPTHLPEGTEVELLLLNPDDWFAPDDRDLLIALSLPHRKCRRAGHQ